MALFTQTLNPAVRHHDASDNVRRARVIGIDGACLHCSAGKMIRVNAVIIEIDN